MRTRALVAGLTLAGSAGLMAVPPAQAATSWPGHPNRELVSYVVRSGDTLTGLAVRYHAWTAELAQVNHLSTHAQLRIGEHLRIPVVVRAQHSRLNAKQRRAEAARAARRARAARIARAVQAVRAHFTYRGATRWRGHRDRILVPHTVRRGETLYSIAVRYYAWTRELAAVNHASAFRVGQRIRIPVVVSVMYRAEAAAIKRAERAAAATPHRTHGTHRTHRTHRHAAARRLTTAQRMVAAGWRDWTMSRRQIRALIIHTARRHGVSPNLALAIGWQESGWHEPLISNAGAIGVMQLLPGTSQWMSFYAGRSLNPRNTRDNVLAGVLFLKYLTAIAGRRHPSQVIAAYYQGMSAIGRKPHWYDDTKQYVRSVEAILRRLA